MTGQRLNRVQTYTGIVCNKEVPPLTIYDFHHNCQKHFMKTRLSICTKSNFRVAIMLYDMKCRNELFFFPAQTIVGIDRPAILVLRLCSWQLASGGGVTDTTPPPPLQGEILFRNQHNSFNIYCAMANYTWCADERRCRWGALIMLVISGSVMSQYPTNLNCSLHDIFRPEQGWTMRQGCIPSTFESR